MGFRISCEQAIFNKGGVLLRGWGVKDVRDAEDLLFQAIGFPQMELYPQTFIDFNLRARELGVPPGGLTQTKLSRNAPPAQDGVMQTPHIEFGLGPHRPRVVGFYVEVPPAVDGSTARVYFPEASALCHMRDLEFHGITLRYHPAWQWLVAYQFNMPQRISSYHCHSVSVHITATAVYLAE